MSKVVEIVDRELFKIRSCDDEEFGLFLYDQSKALLDAVGSKLDNRTRADVQLFTYTESGQKCLQYEVPDEVAKVLIKYFKHNLKDELKKYGQRKKKEGTNLLMQLNSGELSMDEFDKTIKKL